MQALSIICTFEKLWCLKRKENMDWIVTKRKKRR